MNETNNTSPTDNVKKRKPIVFIVVVVLAACGGLFAIYNNNLGAALSAQQAATERRECSHHVKAIVSAILAYEADHGEFPPAFTVDANGNRLHSWRTLILPYLGENELYKQIDLQKAWNDPVNNAAKETGVAVYHCPSDSDDQHMTRYFAVVDDAAIMTGNTPTKMSDITDSKTSTLLVVEGRRDKQVHWMEPNDLQLADFVDIELTDQKTVHPGGVLVASASGFVTFINDSMGRDERYARITRSGGEGL